MPVFVKQHRRARSIVKAYARKSRRKTIKESRREAIKKDLAIPR